MAVKKNIARGTRRRVYKRDSYECVYCGCMIIPDYELSSREDISNIGTIDHVIPGLEEEENYVTACLSCNASKGKRTPKEAKMVLKYGRYWNASSAIPQRKRQSESSTIPLRREQQPVYSISDEGVVLATYHTGRVIKWTQPTRTDKKHHPGLFELLRKIRPDIEDPVLADLDREVEIRRKLYREQQAEKRKWTVCWLCKHEALRSEAYQVWLYNAQSDYRHSQFICPSCANSKDFANELVKRREQLVYDESIYKIEQPPKKNVDNPENDRL